MSKSQNNTKSIDKAVVGEKMSRRSWLSIFGIAMVVGMMAMSIALSRITPSPRSSYLFDRNLRFKGHFPVPFSDRAELRNQAREYASHPESWAESFCHHGVRCALYYGYAKLLL
jgi:hypothetical protein